MASDVGRLLGDGPSRLARPPVTAQVVKVVDGQAWVAPLGTAVDAPIGPCLGPVTVPGDVVLVVFTDAGPWVAQVAP